MNDLWEVPLAEVLGAHERRESLYLPDNGRDFSGILSLKEANNMLASNLIISSFIKIVRRGEVAPRGSYCIRVGMGYDVLDNVVDPAKVRRFWDEGYTVVLQGLHVFWPPLKRFARALEAEIGHWTQINAYITPAGAVGAGQHYDTHDVIILQCEGVKTWELAGFGMVDPLMKHSSEGTPYHEPVEMVRMSPGDVLYVPRGMLHRCIADNRTSVHLTVGMMVATATDVLDYLVGEATKEAAFRRGVPMGNDQEWREDSINTTVDLFTDWARDVDKKPILERLRGIVAGVRRTGDCDSPLGL